jgi:hypothetical protein
MLALPTTFNSAASGGFSTVSIDVANPSEMKYHIGTAKGPPKIIDRREGSGLPSDPGILK